MGNTLGRLKVPRKTGTEQFHHNGVGLGFDLLDFWQWSASNLVDNAARGAVAEYLVARALGIASNGIREGWAPFDLTTASGVKVEVKSAAYVQSWHQTKLSNITFMTLRDR